MANGSAVINTYNTIDVLTADPLRLILMMYDGAIRSLKDYKLFYGRGEYDAKARSLNRVQDILSELRASLNMDAGEIARVLSGLYSYFLQELTHGDVNKDLERIDRVIEMLSELKEGWGSLRDRKESSMARSLPRDREPMKMASIVA